MVNSAKCTTTLDKFLVKQDKKSGDKLKGFKNGGGL